jgi:regulator of replication initiation timing
MMDNETLQKLFVHFVELKNKIDGVATGQHDLKTELKNDIENNISALKNEISAVNGNISALETNVKGDISALETNVKGDISALETDVKGVISALETKVNAGQEELRLENSVFQERIRNIETGQAAFEERATYTVDTVEEHVVHGRAADAQHT